jgi:hypothetical protein
MTKPAAKCKVISRRDSDERVLPANTGAIVRKLASNKKAAFDFLYRAGIITKSGALTSKYK